MKYHNFAVIFFVTTKISWNQNLKFCFSPTVTGTIDVSAAVNAAVDNNEDVVVNLEPTEIVEGQSLSNLEMLTSDGTIVPANNALDVITEDLDISDDSDEDHEPMETNQETKPDPPPPSEEANAPNTASEADDDFMMF